MATFLKITRDGLVFVGPVILGLLIDYTKQDKPPLFLGIFYCFLLFISITTQTVINQQYFDRIFSVGTKMRSIFMNLIYKKSLVLSNDSRKESTVGQMINIIAVNAQYFNEFAHHVTNMWSTLLIILTTIYFLWQKLGLAAIAGVGLMIILVPITSFLTSRNKALQTVKLKHQDSRIKIVNEVLQGIKVLFN